jgi:hypothetical protein
MSTAEWIKTILTILFSGAFFGFIQFLITRKDKKEENSQEERDKNLKKSMEDHLTNVNAKWKEDYCDKNAKAISELVTEVREGLAQREETGRQRYEQHNESIKELIKQHDEDYHKLEQSLEKVITTMKENDDRITTKVEKIADVQEFIGDALVGQAHNTILFIGDHISERKCITNREKATINSMYKPYHNLGGNGEVKEVVEYILSLPTVSEDEAKQKDLELKKKEYEESK